MYGTVNLFLCHIFDVWHFCCSNFGIIKEGIFTNIAYRICEDKFDIIKGLVNIANEVDEEEIRKNRLNNVKNKKIN